MGSVRTAESQSLQQVCKEHSELFLQLVLGRYGFPSLSEAPNVCEMPARALSPIVIEDYCALTAAEKREIGESYQSRFGVAYFIVRNPEARSQRPHALFNIADQLNSMLPARFALPHPLEGHSDAVARFGSPDGTVKIYNLPGKGGIAGYREQAETNEVFDLHHDGLGSGGTVETAILYMDSPALAGGYTYFQNVLLLTLELAKRDPEAFRGLFLPDAITVIRPRGKGAIKVSTPVLFVNDAERPQSFFRVASGEYTVTWKNSEPVARARAFLDRFVPAFSYGSCFVHMSARGHGCIIDNQVVCHARTAFYDDPSRGLQRLLSRKWFMRSERDASYKHVPGMFVIPRFANAYASICNPDILEGEWNYDPAGDANVRIR